MICFLGLGSNLGNRRENIFKAMALLMNTQDLKILESSAIIETAPYGRIDQPDFLNSVIKIETKLGPRNLLSRCLEIEKEMKRVRTEKWEPRIIDIDILLCEDLIIDEKNLCIPHQDLHNRLFVLKPLCQIAAELEHPVLKRTIKELLSEL